MMFEADAEEDSVDTTTRSHLRFRNPVLRTHMGDDRTVEQRAADSIATQGWIVGLHLRVPRAARRLDALQRRPGLRALPARGRGNDTLLAADGVLDEVHGRAGGQDEAKIDEGIDLVDGVEVFLWPAKGSSGASKQRST